MVKYLVTYAFHIINDNVKYFLQHGLINNPNITYVFVQNGNIENSIFNDLLQQYHNLFLYIRNNEGLDFQAYNNVLFLNPNILQYKKFAVNINECSQYLYQLYDKFIFLNCSVIGPYTDNWVQKFTAPLDQGASITGLYCNFMGKKNIINDILLQFCHDKILQHYAIDTRYFSHIQTMAFALNRESLSLLMSYKLFDISKKFSKHKSMVICLGEYAMTAILRYNKKTLYSFMPSQQFIPYNRKDNTDNELWQNKNFSYAQLIFVKPKYMPQFKY